MPRRMRALLPALLLLVLPGVAWSQDPQPDTEHVPSWASDLGVGSANALAGALTAAVLAWVNDQDVPRAFLRGAVGGTVVFAGKRLAVEPFDGAGFLGREVGALGSSVVANASTGRGWLDEAWLPLGPLWIRTGFAAPVGVAVNVRELATIGWAASRSELELDWGASLSNGTAIFRAAGHQIRFDGEEVGGIAVGGVVLLSRRSFDAEVTRGHEVVHVIQDDFFTTVLSRPGEQWVWRRLSDGRLPVELGIATALRLLAPIHALEEAEAGSLGWR